MFRTVLNTPFVKQKQPLADVFEKKKEIPPQVLSCKYYEIFKNSIFYRYLVAASDQSKLLLSLCGTKLLLFTSEFLVRVEG